MLSKFQLRFFTDLEPNLSIFGPPNRPKINQKSPSWPKNSKTGKPSKTTVFTSVFEGTALQNLLKNPKILSKCRFRNRSKFLYGLLVDFDQFASLLEQFCITFEHFWRLEVPQAWFWATLGTICGQTRGLGCNLVALGSHFCNLGFFLVDFGTKSRRKFDKIQFKSNLNQNLNPKFHSQCVNQFSSTDAAVSA